MTSSVTVPEAGIWIK